MKKLIISALFVMMFIPLVAQTYTVVKVFGKVESPTLNRSVKPGDKIVAKDQLKFDNKDSYIIVTSAQTGNKKIAGVADAKPHEFVTLLESFIKPGKKPTASRGIPSDYIEEIYNTMNFDTLLIVGDGLIPINTDKLPLTSPAAVKVLYATKDETVHRKISTLENFCISEKCMFGGAAPKPSPRVAIFYFQDEQDAGAGAVLGSFVPVYANNETLLAEIKALVAFVEVEKKNADILTEIQEYLSSEYSKAQIDNLKTWLTANGVKFKK